MPFSKRHSTYPPTLSLCHPVGMETEALPDEDDASALKTRREELRDYAAQVARAIEAIEMPESFIEGERAARFVIIADKLIVRLPRQGAQPEDIKPARKRLRLYADRLLDKIKHMPMPETFLEGERAGRCVLATDRMLGQLYEAPGLPTRVTGTSHPVYPRRPAKDAYASAPQMDAVKTEAEKEAEAKAAHKALMGMVNRMTSGYARFCGYWPDGSPYEPGTHSDNHHFAIIDQITMAQDIEGGAEHRTAALITGRANAIVSATAWKTGYWPDGSPFNDADDPEYFHISDRFDSAMSKHPPDPTAEPPNYDETDGPPGFPWWLIRRVKKSDTG